MSSEKDASWSWSSDVVSQRHVNHLRLVTQLSFAQQYKQQSHTLLQLKPGHHVLDVGCGLGDDVVALAQLVGPDGRVVGIDHSETMLEQAIERHNSSDLRVEFLHIDARHMTFNDKTFDGVRTDRVLQHIPDMPAAIAEIVRVLKPGGRVVLNETDWDTLTLNVTDRALFRKIRSHHTDTGIRNGWMGRQLAGLLAEHQLEHITPMAHTAFFTDYAFTKQWGVWHRAVQNALEAGIITQQATSMMLKNVPQKASTC